MSEYYCTNCDSDLEDQIGFDPDCSHWTCTECGQLLFDPGRDDSDSRFEDVGWFCDECGDYLNDQPGFSDWYDSWVCTECGHTNYISEDEIDGYSNLTFGETLVKSLIGGAIDGIIEGLSEGKKRVYDNDDDDDDEYFDSDDHEVVDDDEEDDEIEEYVVLANNENKNSEFSSSSKRCSEECGEKTAVERFWRTITGKKKITGVSSGDFISLKYDYFENLLRNAEYEKIEYIPHEILDLNDIDKEGLVTNISINGLDNFELNDKIIFNPKIEIHFLKIKKVKMPISSGQSKGMDVNSVKALLNKAGFVTINKVAIYDLRLGWFKKDGEVENVTVDGSNVIKDAKYRLDSVITIEYHTFMRKK